MTERQTELAAALLEHRRMYAKWQRDQATDPELRATELRARRLGASDQDIRDAEAMTRLRQEPMQ